MKKAAAIQRPAVCRRATGRRAVRPLAALLAGFLALAAAGAVQPASALAARAPQDLPALSGGPALSSGPVTVGDRSSLSRLAVRNLGSAGADLAGLDWTENPRGLTAVALTAVSGLSGLRSSSAELKLSPDFVLTPSRSDFYSRTVELAEQYRITTQALPASLPEARLSAAAPLYPDGRDDSAALTDIQLTGRPVPPGELGLDAGLDVTPPTAYGGLEITPAGADRGSDATGAYDLVATIPLLPSKVAVSAHYRLVDLDRLAGEAAAAERRSLSGDQMPQTMGVGGKIALNGGALLKAGYEVTRQNGALTSIRTDAGVTLRLDPRTDLSAGLTLDRTASGASASPSAGSAGGPVSAPTPLSQVRTSFGLGYRLSGDAALRASYTLINFGTRPSPSQARHEASAELSLRF